MTLKRPNKLTPILLSTCAAMLLIGCNKKENSPIEEIEERTLDALDARENEKIKDAAEDLEDAAENASDAIKEKIEEINE